MMQSDIPKRIWFWSFFLSAVVAVYVFGIQPRQRMLDQARRTANILRPVIAADPRFTAVRVSPSTNGGILILGVVSSDADLDALKNLVAHTDTPRRPGIDVHVSLDSQ
jgi:hypothetical protein